MCDLGLRGKEITTQDCEAYLVHMVFKSSLEVTLDNVSIVREFSSVFPKDVLGLL